MAVDKLVDSTQLNSDLTSVANAIRTKSGGSSPLAFPAGFVSEIGNISGGDPNENLRGVLDGSVTSYTDDLLTSLKVTIPRTLTSFICHNITSVTGTTQLLNGANLVSLALPNLLDFYNGFAFASCGTIEILDIAIYRLAVNSFSNCTKLATLILRNPSVVTLGGTNAFTNTPFKSGGTGGTIYIPKSLYDHLGDGTSSDYKAATNWSTVNGYGTITWAKIEGSTYETHYGDGTTIPT